MLEGTVQNVHKTIRRIIRLEGVSQPSHGNASMAVSRTAKVRIGLAIHLARLNMDSAMSADRPIFTR